MKKRRFYKRLNKEQRKWLRENQHLSITMLCQVLGLTENQVLTELEILKNVDWRKNNGRK